MSVKSGLGDLSELVAVGVGAGTIMVSRLLAERDIPIIVTEPNALTR